MKNLNLATVGAVCALVTVAGFVVGIVLSISGGVEVLIPETGTEGLEWIADVQDAGDLFTVSAWIVVFASLFGLIALVGFYGALREAGPVMIIAPIAGVVGLTLVTISHVIPVAMAHELAPGYSEANEATQASLGVTFDTLASLSALTNYFENALGWGVAVPLYAIAILTTSALPRWIGWLGLVVAFLQGGWGCSRPRWASSRALPGSGSSASSSSWRAWGSRSCSAVRDRPPSSRRPRALEHRGGKRAPSGVSREPGVTVDEARAQP